MIRRFRNDENGSALVETAIVVPVAFLLFAGGVSLAQLIYKNHEAEKAIRYTTRYMARLPEASATATLAGQLLDSQIQTPQSRTVAVAIRSVGACPSRYDLLNVSSTLTYAVPLISMVTASPAFTFNVAHEEVVLDQTICP